MDNRVSWQHFFLAILFVLFSFSAQTQQLKDFYATVESHSFAKTVDHDIQFNGYTRYWHNTYTSWFRYANLFKMATPELEKTILQSKINIAEELGFPGLVLQEGFMNELLSSEFDVLKNPDQSALEAGLKKGNVLVLADPGSYLGGELLKMGGGNFDWPLQMKSYQYDLVDLNKMSAFYLSDGNKKIFVLSSSDSHDSEKLLDLINHTDAILDKYNLHKGWFGAKSLLKSVTATPGHPLEIIGKGMNEGCSWFIFDGYMDFIAQPEILKWMKDVDLPIVADAGFSPIYGCDDYIGLQVQDMATKEEWYKYAHSKGGYAFKPVWDTAWRAPFDGYVAIEGNKEQIDEEDVPFVAATGFLADNLTTSMMLFIEKSKTLSKESIWDAIMNRREVAVLEQAKMMGPAKYRNALQLLYLDRVFLENYYGDRLDIQAHTEGYELKVTLRNLSDDPASGELQIDLPNGLSLSNEQAINIGLPAHSEKQLSLTLRLAAEAMQYTNPIGVHFTWDNMQKSTIAMLDLPPAISMHRLLYSTSDVLYPVSVHNFTNDTTFPVKLEAFPKNGKKRAVLTQTEITRIPPGGYAEIPFEFPLKKGEYLIKVTALGTSAEGQLGVESTKGTCSLYETDLNSDGMMEYRMENDSVQVTLLAIGARVIEYIVKSRDDNVLFKIWPKKAIDDKRPFRKRGFYPYGGFEDFLGQGSMETHRVYDARIIKKEGEYVQVVMETDYYGNKLKKTFTLYGNSPLLEVRFALDFKNPEANVIGPQPILELGDVHGPEDVFACLTLDGLKEYRMRPEMYYGAVIQLKEGWNAGYDTQADVNFVGAFPVDQPLYLHMWMNHPSNGESHHYYVEFQPWVPIIQKNTFYFSYYLWGSGGAWQNGVEELRKRNLVTVR
jgi:hypothetical protein